MKQTLFFLLLASTLMFPRLSTAESIVLGNGDILRGTITTAEFRLHTPYGGIKAAADDLKMINRNEEKREFFSLLTVNNDFFTGALLPETVDIQLYSGGLRTIAQDRIENIFFTFDGATEAVDTTLFFMKNGDMFSGELLNDTLSVQTEHETHVFQRDDFSRLIFHDEPGAVMVSSLLNDGTLIVGRLLDEQLRVIPESVSPLTPCQPLIRKIQFNSRKLVLLTVPSLSDPTYVSGLYDPSSGCLLAGDGVPADHLDRCPGTPRNLPVNKYGCWELRIPHFDFDRSDIRTVDSSLLRHAVHILTTYPDMKIEVQGHTDGRGTEAYNLTLSLRRANAVKRFLVNMGIDPKRLTVTGYGKSRPIATNETDQGRALNRRVMLLQAP